MKRVSFIWMFLFGMFFVVSTPLYAQQQDTNAIMDALNSELEKAAVFTRWELKSTEKSLKNMLKKGAHKDDIKNILIDLASKGVKGKDFRRSVNSMNDLVNSGEDFKRVGNIVSRAAHQAQAQGLKGKDLAAKVHEAIQKRKMQREEMKEQKRQMKQERKEMKQKRKGDSE